MTGAGRDWSARTVGVPGRVELPGWRPVDDRLLRDEAGGVLWLLNPPQRRQWLPTGALLPPGPVTWTVEPTNAGAAIVVERGAGDDVEADLVELRGPAAASFPPPPAEPLLVLGTFHALGGADDLAPVLVGGRMVDTNVMAGRRYQSEQVALSVYRIARWRSGPFWDAVADHVAEVVARRVAEAPGGLPVHDAYGEGESHTRFLLDAVLLLLAEAERRPDDPRWRDLADRGLAALETLAVPWGGGRWYLHDSYERARRTNDLVLNTHVHALVVRRAAGLDVAEGQGALDAALSLRADSRHRLGLTAAVLASDAARAVAPTRLARRAQALFDQVQHAAARSRARTPHLALPGGWLARDVRPEPSPGYLTVNLHDLAVLQRIGAATPTSSAALRRGLRYAQASGHLRALRRAAYPAVAMLPTILENVGAHRAATRAAARLGDTGWAPMIGWPGWRDHLWSSLAAGTP